MSKFSRLFNFSGDPIAEIEPGLYTSNDLTHDDEPYRLHLRVENNQTGILTLNASTILHLNKTAMEMAYFLIQGQNTAQISKTINKRYNAPKKEIQADVERFYETLMQFIGHEDLPPTGLYGVISDPEETEIIAPYRLDCSFSATETGTPLSLAEWKVVLEKAYNAGIPHIMFLDVPEEHKPDLIELLNDVEVLGLVSGLVAKPEWLMDSTYVDSLINSGLDHLVLDANPCNAEHHALITSILDKDLFTCLRMDFEPEQTAPSVFESLMAHGLNAVAYNAVPLEMTEKQLAFEAMLGRHNIPIVDDMPYPTGHVLEQPELLGRDNMDLRYLRLDRNGTLLIPNEKRTEIGNLLDEPWDVLWSKCRALSHG